MGVLADTVRAMGRGKTAGLAMGALVMMSLFVVLLLRMSTGNMVPLYTNLSLEDSAKIVAELEKNSTPYELVASGTQIMVPADRVLRMRMNMAQQGLPSGGSIVGYEIFDRSESFGTSTFVMNVNMMRALEGELARTIGSINGVDSARVHLVMPKRELFTRDKEPPSASVTVRMRGGNALERAEVTAISHLVASAVPGLAASRVTIVDGHGRLVARGSGEEDLGTAVSTAQEYRTGFETRMEKTLEDLLEKVVGMGKVRVQVAADIDFDRIITNSEKYDPDGQVVRSTQSTTGSENSQDQAGGDSVSAANNLPGAAATGGQGNTSSNLSEQASETTNYEISKTVQNHVKEAGGVKKLSIAALVDGTYANSEDGEEETYAPRPQEELDKLKTLIASAIGFDEKRGDKIEVVNMRFTQDSFKVGEESFFERFKLEMQGIVQTLIIAVVAILAILLVLRPAVTQLVKQLQTPSDRVAGELAAIEGPGGAQARLPAAMGGGESAPEQELLIDVANIKGGMKSSSMKKINEIVDKYPEETMGVLRQWILRQS